MSLIFGKSSGGKDSELKGAKMSPFGSYAVLPTHKSESNGYTLLSGPGSEYSAIGSRSIHINDEGIYLSPRTGKAIVAFIATAGLVLSSLVIALSFMLGSYQGAPVTVSAVLHPAALRMSATCGGFIMNSQVDNFGAWTTVPTPCISQVEAYMQAQYYVDFGTATAAAFRYVTSLPLKGDGTEVVVMDIDETSLSNLPYYANHHYGAENFNAGAWNDWILEGAASPLPDSAELFNNLKTVNVSVVFLTGRTEDQRNVTVSNLLAEGYADWGELILRPPDEAGLDAVDYKSKHRLQLEAEGYTILACVGDQWSDLTGPACGKRGFKVPNPMYYIA